jgi:putative endonuclease
MRVDENRLTATYVMASRKYGTLYVGSALDLIARVWEHKEGVDVTRLVWFEPHLLITEARGREYEIKGFRREWKINLIEANNPDWNDLYPVLSGARLR